MFWSRLTKIKLGTDMNKYTIPVKLTTSTELDQTG